MAYRRAGLNKRDAVPRLRGAGRGLAVTVRFLACARNDRKGKLKAGGNHGENMGEWERLWGRKPGWE